jgi:putative tricarboxylic transport membrane protein
MTDTTRRSLLAAAAAALAAPLPLTRFAMAPAAAQAAPPIDLLRLFVPSAPGGGWDGLARVVEKVLRETGAIGAAQVENVAGAGGAIGLPRFVALRGRRNTLMVAGLSLVSAAIVNKSPVTAARDTIPLARLQGEAHVLVVPADSPFRTLADFIAAFRADPRATSVAGGSAGGTDHMTLGFIGKALGVPADRLSYVAFNSGGPAANAVVGAQVKAGIANWAEWAPHIEGGRMRALGLTSEARVPGIDVPTFREAGVDVVFYNWRGVFAPLGIPEEHVAQLGALIEAMANGEPWRREAEQRGWQRIYLPRREFAAFLDAETWAVEAVLKDLGLAG